MATAKKKVDLRGMRVARIEFSIVGITPIIFHAWDEKVKRELALAKTNRAKGEYVDKDPDELAKICLYRTDDGEVGFPMLAFKSALISAAHKDIGLEKTAVRKAFFLPSSSSGSLIVPLIFSGDYVIREDLVRIGMGAPDIRYRPMITDWSVRIVGTLDVDVVSPSSFFNLVNRAGFGIGVGEWRPEKGGEFGRFRVDTSVETVVDMIEV